MRDTKNVHLDKLVGDYLVVCSAERGLDHKTRSAYAIDLSQFCKYLGDQGIADIRSVTKQTLIKYIETLNERYKFATIKRKLASISGLFQYLEDEEKIEVNPVHRLRFRKNQEKRLPKVISRDHLSRLFATAYREINLCKPGTAELAYAVRDCAIVELLFATGMRVSELCNVRRKAIDLSAGTVAIYGKGRKERVVPLVCESAVAIIRQLDHHFAHLIAESDCLLFTSRGEPLGDQAVRQIIRQLCRDAGIKSRITPHMFRHTVATMLLENGVDIRIIQHLLGHSSIAVTEIYTQVNLAPQTAILKQSHPRASL